MHIGWQKFDLRGPGHLVVNINISLLYSYVVACAKMLKEIQKNIRLCCYYFYHRWHYNCKEGRLFAPHPWLHLGREKFKQASPWEISFVDSLQNFYWIYSRSLLLLKRFSLNFFSDFSKKISN